MDTDHIIALNEFIGALVTGYAADSHLNNGNDKNNLQNPSS